MTYDEMRAEGNAAATAAKEEIERSGPTRAVLLLDVAERWYRLAELERGPFITLPPSKEWDQ